MGRKSTRAVLGHGNARAFLAEQQRVGRHEERLRIAGARLCGGLALDGDLHVRARQQAAVLVGQLHLHLHAARGGVDGAGGARDGAWKVWPGSSASVTATSCRPSPAANTPAARTDRCAAGRSAPA
ncbi:hypothetical protein [Arthrobacter methylotrophus]|uniref:hypothetical protein n=1 Tax=Arthrobacter methylotrophus TaxID=121291 RepID=UPI0031EA906A